MTCSKHAGAKAWWEVCPDYKKVEKKQTGKCQKPGRCSSVSSLLTKMTSTSRANTSLPLSPASPGSSTATSDVANTDEILSPTSSSPCSDTVTVMTPSTTSTHSLDYPGSDLETFPRSAATSIRSSSPISSITTDPSDPEAPGFESDISPWDTDKEAETKRIAKLFKTTTRLLENAELLRASIRKPKQLAQESDDTSEMSILTQKTVEAQTPRLSEGTERALEEIRIHGQTLAYARLVEQEERLRLKLENLNGLPEERAMSEYGQSKDLSRFFRRRGSFAVEDPRPEQA